MGICSRDKFSLHHTDIGLFHSSHWSEKGVTSRGYLIYRVTIAVLMVAGIIAHIIDFTENNPGYKWLIYMTNQGITILTLHYLLYSTVVMSNYLLPRGFTYNGSLPLLYKLSWALQNMASSVALFITIVYWSLLHPIVVEHGLMAGPWKSFLNVFLHLFNTLSYLIDIFVTARPKRIHHFYFAVIFGLWYMAFSLVYWASGGTGRCYCAPQSLTNSTTTISPEDCLIKCDKFIYPILDWEDNPGLAVGMIGAGVVAMPLIQTFWWACTKLRKYIGQKFCQRRSSSRAQLYQDERISVRHQRTVSVN